VLVGYVAIDQALSNIKQERAAGEDGQNALLTFSRLELSVQELVSEEM
jgi:hypothetical protein